MSDRDEELDRLDDLLNAVPAVRGAMSLSRVDGYVAALIVCPEVIPPSEWLPRVWGGEHTFGTVAELEETVAAVMGHYNRVALALMDDPESYALVFDVGPASEDVSWKPWVEGFELAMRLRAGTWEEIALSDDAEAAASVGLIIAMHDFGKVRSDLTDEAIDDLGRMAPELIPSFVQNLNAWKKSRGLASHPAVGATPGARFGTIDPPAFGRKVGRNEPCPCGSGRKYKRCCSAN